ncbi:MAG: recombination mediator RecR [Verrucomicrobiota bacterium]
MTDYPPAMRELIEALRLLPSVGPRGAERLALFLLSEPEALSERLARAVYDARKKIAPCPECGNFAEAGQLCSICRDPNRDRSVWCVVEQASDILPLEKAGRFRGLYHVLGGRLSPIDGVGPDELNVEKLFERVRRGSPAEIILALSSEVEGETTALYLAPKLKELGVRVSRPARGLPAAGGLAYADSVTLGYALDGRSEL